MVLYKRAPTPVHKEGKRCFTANNLTVSSTGNTPPYGEVDMDAPTMERRRLKGYCGRPQHKETPTGRAHVHPPPHNKNIDHPESKAMVAGMSESKWCQTLAEDEKFKPGRGRTRGNITNRESGSGSDGLLILTASPDNCILTNHKRTLTPTRKHGVEENYKPSRRLSPATKSRPLAPFGVSALSSNGRSESPFRPGKRLLSHHAVRTPSPATPARTGKRSPPRHRSPHSPHAIPMQSPRDNPPIGNAQRFASSPRRYGSPIPPDPATPPGLATPPPNRLETSSTASSCGGSPRHLTLNTPNTKPATTPSSSAKKGIPPAVSSHLPTMGTSLIMPGTTQDGPAARFTRRRGAPPGQFQSQHFLDFSHGSPRTQGIQISGSSPRGSFAGGSTQPW
eukprot:TRINITY_DN66838_c6_g12_i2.p1 TRINITY_DN66838_c6_g12~~TRINITY_DN66838_c6_g12_i2.p1  ORF type:complete len:393 (-),score=6.03 TRINITY_DN66838_c6_g12_i2:316-1494(-)